MTAETTTNEKQITVDVPEDRVAEFYAFYGRFLAGFPGRRRRGHGPRGHRCGHHGEHAETREHAEPTPQEQPSTTEAGAA